MVSMRKARLLTIAAMAVVLCSLTTKADDVSVLWDVSTGTYSLRPGVVDGWVAYATFENKINKTGWSYLEVYTNGKAQDEVQAYAAGLAEGHLTQDLIAMHWHNVMSDTCDMKNLSTSCKKVIEYFEENFTWISYQIEDLAKQDPYWHQIKLFLIQVNGLDDGYLNTPKYARYTVNMLGLMFFQVLGDLEDLSEVLGVFKERHVLGSGSCSALIKLLPDNKDLYVSQDTWTGFNSMLRILKKYDFQYHLSGDAATGPLPGQVMTFSSYPGTLMSGDDLYVISSGLVTLETTIGNNNPNLWSHVTPEGTVAEGIRSMVANRLARFADEWCQIFRQHNSGTYNNQWMIVDMKLFTPGMPRLLPGTLLLLEQIPGMIVYRDVTSQFEEQRYWPSYNTPYFEEIFNEGYFNKSAAKYGDWFTYDRTPRALIFRRDHSKVTDMDSMIKLMRYNDYTHDPLSACNCTPPYSGENAIAARSDLNPADGTYPFGALGHRNHGATDAKITTSDLARSLEFIAAYGPPFDNVPPFQWSKADFKDTVKHVGLPDLYKFEPELHKWGDRPTQDAQVSYL